LLVYIAQDSRQSLEPAPWEKGCGSRHPFTLSCSI
jgi:hypothetical protein